MGNSLKKFIFGIYIWYHEKIPVEKGKYFFGKWMFRCYGFAVYG